MQENSLSKRQAHIQRLRKGHPDIPLDDDEQIFGAISDDYDRLESENSAMREREKTLSDMLSSDVRSAYFLNDMRQGIDPVVSLIKRFGPELKDIIDDPDMHDKISQAGKEFNERAAKSAQFDQLYDQNIARTLGQTLPQFQQQRNLSDDDIDKIGTAWIQIVREGVLGILSPETATLIADAIYHDKDVASAKEEGNIAGRNAQIDMKLRRAAQSDGVSNLAGRNASQSPQKPQSIFDLAREAD